MKSLQQGYNERGSAYQARCALAEKLGDQSLRKWCVEQITKSGKVINYGQVDALFVYVKERKVFGSSNG